MALLTTSAWAHAAEATEPSKAIASSSVAEPVADPAPAKETAASDSALSAPVANASSAPAAIPSGATSTSKLPFGSVSAPKFGAFTLNASLKSTNNSARGFEYDNPVGRRYSMKTEYTVGTTHASGWGLSAMAVTRGTTFGADSTKTAYGAGDPSVTVTHPIYKDESVKWTGQIRKYFLVTDASKKRGYDQWAYYLNTNWTLPRGWTISNQLVPRAFLQANYKKGEPVYFVEDTVIANKALYPWMKIGIGEHMALETHEGKGTGTFAEVFPTVSFTPSSNASIEARWLLPIEKNSDVADSAGNVAVDNSQAQVTLQISM